MRRTLRAGLDARPADARDQVEGDAAYIRDRGWGLLIQVRDVGSGAKDRLGVNRLLKAARRREIDVIVVWRLDRWGRSLPDLVVTLRELTELGIGFVSLSEAHRPDHPTGRAMAGMLAVFAEFEREILRERVGIARPERGRPHGRPPTASLKADEVLVSRPSGRATRRSPGARDRADLGAGQILTAG